MTLTKNKSLKTFRWDRYCCSASWKKKKLCISQRVRQPNRSKKREAYAENPRDLGSLGANKKKSQSNKLSLAKNHGKTPQHKNGLRLLALNKNPAGEEKGKTAEEKKAEWNP